MKKEVKKETKKKSKYSYGFLSKEEIKKRAKDYYNFTKSYRFFSLLTLVFMTLVSIFIAKFTNKIHIENVLIDLFLIIIPAAYLVFKGHKWVYIALILYWTLNLGYGIYINPKTSISKVFFWWYFIYIYINAFKIEQEVDRLGLRKKKKKIYPTIIAVLFSAISLFILNYLYSKPKDLNDKQRNAYSILFTNFYYWNSFQKTTCEQYGIDYKGKNNISDLFIATNKDFIFALERDLTEDEMVDSINSKENNQKVSEQIENLLITKDLSKEEFCYKLKNEPNFFKKDVDFKLSFPEEAKILKDLTF